MQNGYTRQSGHREYGVVSTQSEHPEKVQQVLDVGYEVIIHEIPVAQGVGSGSGHVAIDPSHLVEDHLIEGVNNEGFLEWQRDNEAYIRLAIAALFFGAVFAVEWNFIVIVLDVPSAFFCDC